MIAFSNAFKASSYLPFCKDVSLNLKYNSDDSLDFPIASTRIDSTCSYSPFSDRISQSAIVEGRWFLSFLIAILRCLIALCFKLSNCPNYVKKKKLFFCRFF